MENKKEQTGSLAISRTHGDDPHIELRITDNVSRVRFATMRLTFEQLTLAITGMHIAEAPLVTKNLKLVGRKRLHRQELVHHPNKPLFMAKDGDAEKSCDEVAARLKAETGLDWEPFYSDATNMHRRDPKTGAYKVGFYAYEKKKKRKKVSDG